MKKYLLALFLLAGVTLNSWAQCTPPTVVKFLADTTCDGSAVTFIDSCTGIISGVHSYEWDMNGDAIVDFTTSGNQSYTYFSAGLYTAKLTIKDTGGCQTVYTQQIVIVPNHIVVGVIADTVCAGSLTTFTAVTTPLGASPAYIWDLNSDGAVDTTTSVAVLTYMLPTAGVYNSILKIQDGRCSNSDTIAVLVNNGPIAKFLAQNASVCFGDTVKFTDLSSSVSPSCKYSWDFESDGATDDTLAGDKSVVYTALGTIKAVLTIVDGQCSSSDTVSINIGVRPSTNITTVSDTVCTGATVQINDLSSGTSSTSSYKWDFNNDGIVDDTTHGNQTISYTMAGNYWAKVTIANGVCTSSDSVNIVALSGPMADFSAINACIGDSVRYTDLSTNTFGSSYAWDFNNDNVVDDVTAGNKAYLFAGTGSYTTKLTLTSPNGCQSVKSLSVLVAGYPVADFSTANTTVCQNSPTEFINQSGSALSTATYYWDFENDGTVDLVQSGNVYHTFANVTSYNVKLKVVNTPAGCADSIVKIVTVGTNPLNVNAGIDKTLICGNATQLNATTSNAGVTFQWSPTTGLSNPFIAYPTTNATETIIYGVIISKNGCSATDSVTVFVNPLTVAASPDKIANCGDAISLNSSANVPSGVTYNWMPTTGLSNPGISNPVSTPTSNITYVVTASKGVCIATDTVNITIGSLAVNGGNDKTIICGSSVMLASNTPASGVVYNWSPAAGLSNSLILNPTASPSQTTTYVLSATKGSCSSTDTVLVMVTPFQTSAGADRIVTCGNSVALSATAALSGVNYSWSPLSTLTNPYTATPMARPEVTTSYVVTTTKGNCISTDTVLVTVDPSIAINFYANKTRFTNLSGPYNVQFYNTTPNKSYFTFNWSFGDGVTSSATDPTHAYALKGSYDVMVVATSPTGGCRDTVFQANYIQCAVDPNALNKVTLAEMVNLYPNPSSNGDVFITMNDNSKFSYRIFNALGQEVKGTSQELLYNNTLKISGLRTGMYMIEIGVKDVKTLKKLIVN